MREHDCYLTLKLRMPEPPVNANSTLTWACVLCASNIYANEIHPGYLLREFKSSIGYIPLVWTLWTWFIRKNCNAKMVAKSNLSTYLIGIHVWKMHQRKPKLKKPLLLILTIYLHILLELNLLSKWQMYYLEIRTHNFVPEEFDLKRNKLQSFNRSQ